MAASSATPSSVSCTGISSSSVTRCTAVCGERSTAMTPSDCALIGPTLARPPTSCVMLRKRAIRPVGGASSTTASYAGRPVAVGGPTASLTLPVSSTSRMPGRDRRGELDGADPAQRAGRDPGRRQLVEHVQVVQQRVLGVDRPARRRRRRPGATATLRSSYGSGGQSNSWAMPWRPSTSHEQHAPAAGGEGQGEGGGDRGLAGAALAGHDVQAHAGKSVTPER